MGGSSSKPTRKLTIENDDPTSVIKVSDEVVERLKGNQGGVRRPAGSPSSGIPSGGVVPVVPAPAFLYEPSLTSLQIRQANVAELKKNDAYWEKRIRDMEVNHKKMHDVMEIEYNKALQENAPKKDEARNYLPPCTDNQQAIVDCYKKYPNEPLRCAKEVQEFAECVDFKRNVVLNNRG